MPIAGAIFDYLIQRNPLPARARTTTTENSFEGIHRVRLVTYQPFTVPVAITLSRDLYVVGAYGIKIRVVSRGVAGSVSAANHAFMRANASKTTASLDGKSQPNAFIVCASGGSV